jgi:hypothetical protein
MKRSLSVAKIIAGYICIAMLSRTSMSALLVDHPNAVFIFLGSLDLGLHLSPGGGIAPLARPKASEGRRVEPWLSGRSDFNDTIATKEILRGAKIGIGAHHE